MSELFFRIWTKLIILICLLGTQTQAELVSSTTQNNRNTGLNLSLLPKGTQTNLEKQFPYLNISTPSPQEVDQILRFLVLQEQFDWAIAEEYPVGKYTIKASRATIISAIRVNGNKTIRESEILRASGFTEKKILDKDLFNDAKERILQLYADQGYYQTRVEISFKNLSESSSDLRIDIFEEAQTRIQEIDIISRNPEFRMRLRRFLRKYLDQPLTETTVSDMRKASREFFSKNSFFKVELPDPEISLSENDTQGKLTFTIENPVKYHIEFLGAQQISESSLSHNLDLSNFYSANPNIASELGGRVKQIYLNRGFSRVDVDSVELDSAKSFERKISVKIEEGPKIKIERVDITGRLTESPEFYLKTLRRGSDSIVTNGTFVREDLEKSIEFLINERRNQGFLKARAISKRTIYNKERNKVLVAINFDEGPLTIVQKVSFLNVSAFSEQLLREQIGLDPLRPLKLSQLEEGLQRLRKFYRDAGYLEMEILNEKQDLVLYNEDSTLAQVQLKIYEGPLIRVGSVIVEGNTLTKDSVVLKEVDFSPGDLLTPEKIEESTARLERLGHFSSVEIKTLEEKTQVSQRTVIVRVSDRDPGLFNLGIGATNERQLTVRGYSGIAYRNIGGTGRGLSLRLDGNYNVSEIKFPEYKITLGYLEPYLFDSRIRGRMNFSQAVTVTNFENLLASEIKQTVFALEQDLTSDIFLSWDVLSLERYKDFSVIENPRYPDATVDIGSTAINLDLDYRNHPFNATRGHRTLFNLEYGGPNIGANQLIEYFRSSISFTHYVPLTTSGTWTWANLFRNGYLRNLSTLSGSGVPYDKKGFQLGGQTTLRGFQPSEAFPNANELGTEKYRLQNSASMFLFKSELRFPLHKSLGGAFFYDGGSVWIWGDQNSIREAYRHTVGIGIRYTLPIGAVSFEQGWKLNPQAYRNENPFSFHFSIGTF
jgi:outer membrane protein insertion porin family